MLYAVARGAVPLRGADHRLHRRDPDAVPVRADAGRRRRLRLGGGDDPRPAAAGDASAACCSAWCSSSALAPDHPRHRGRPRRGQRGRQHPGARQHPLLPLRLRLRGHQRAADHRGRRRDGARPPRAAHPEGHPGRRWPPQRMRDYAEHGKHLGPLPPPGVFARHNAVDTPALLPDGTASEASVSRVLAARGTVRSAPASPTTSRSVQRAIAPAERAPAVDPETPASRRRPADDRGGRPHDRVRRPLRDPVHDRLRRGADPAQRDRGVHVRRADAQRLQPRPGRLRPASTATSTARSPPSS